MLLLHAAVIALVMLTRSGKSVDEKPGVMAFDIATGGKKALRRSAVRPHHRHIATLPVTPTPLLQVAQIDFDQGLPEISSSSAVPAAALPTASGGGCDLTPPIQDALRESAAVRRQLPFIPDDRRSVANAIVVWNAGWTDTGAAPVQAAFATIRQTITQSVTASATDCRNQMQRGPRLLYLPVTAGKTMVLAVGSGQWSWQQLLDGQPLSAETIAAGAASSPAPFASSRQAVTVSQTPSVDALLASLVRKRSSERPAYSP